MKLKHIALIGNLFPILFSLVLFFGVLISADSDDENSNFSSGITGMNLSAEVLKHQPIDVYKRQTWFVITEFIIILFGNIPPLSMIEGAFLKYFGIPVALTWFMSQKTFDGKKPYSFLKSQITYALRPVSYTHLDVYKRQMKVEVAFTFDATSLDGKQLVTFEELYDLSNPDEPKKVTEHKDIDNEGQTITFKEKPEVPEEPETPPTPEKPCLLYTSSKSGECGNFVRKGSRRR